MNRREIPSRVEVDIMQSGLYPDQQSIVADVLRDHIALLSPKDTGKSATQIRVIPDDENRRLMIMMPNHLWALNNGFDAFIMRGLIGKTIPIRLPNGMTIFRRATEENVGAHRITSRDPKTGRIQVGNKPIAWRHPGHRALQFVQQGIQRAKPVMAKMVIEASLRRMMDAR